MVDVNLVTQSSDLWFYSKNNCWKQKEEMNVITLLFYYDRNIRLTKNHWICFSVGKRYALITSNHAYPNNHHIIGEAHSNASYLK